MPAPNVVRELVETFSANIGDYKKPTFKEAQLRSQFLDRFLEALGWDVANRAGYAEQYKEVIVEDALEDEGRNCAPDYCFRIGKERKYFVEAKKPSIDVGRDRAAAYQLRRYAWSAKLPLSIVTDFEELSIYDTRVKPEPSDRVSTARIKTFHFSEYVDRWDELNAIFSKDAVLKGSFDRYATNNTHRGTVEVDEDFLTTLEDWRLKLANGIRRQNPHLKIDEISYVVQVTLDRILFLRICEDKGIEPFGTLRSTSAKKGSYGKLVELFRNAQQRYNSGLFHLFSEGKSDSKADKLSADVKIADSVIYEIISGLYHPKPYEFSVISTDILGSVYERFLGSELVISGRSVTSELKPERKKAGGVFYTPAPVARYMVGASIKKAFNVGSTERPRLRILDMACGSGSFLIHAYDELLHLYADWHASRGTKPGAALMKVPTKDGASELRLTLAERKKILRDHIFGVDLDPQAVEVAKLSLFLKLIEDVDVLPIQRELGPFQSRILPDLSDNVKWGNSIVDHDVFSAVALSDEEVIQFRPFSWDKDDTFGPITRDGGFDVIIGNPPYSYRKSTIDKFKKYYLSKYISTQGNFDVYKMFLERSSELVRPSGTVCQIVNASFLVQPQFAKLRNTLLDRFALQELAVLGPNVFKGVTIDTAIIRGTRRGRGVKTGKVIVKEPENPALVATAKSWEASQSRFAANDGNIFDWRLSDLRASIVNRIFETYPSIDSFYDLSVGINTGSMKDELVSDSKNSKSHHPCVPGTGIARYGRVTTAGYILYDPKVIKAAGTKGRSLPPERFFTSDKILVVRTRNTSLKRRIVATIDSEKRYHLNRLTSIIAQPGSDIKTLLAILNSSIVNYLFLTKLFNYEIKPVFLRQVPIPTCKDRILSDLVDKIVEANLDLDVATTPSQKATLQTKIAGYEIRIDARVIELYGLSPAEVRTITDHMTGLPGTLTT
ncbi:Eco57I restriction-modification methylase domain-containing protein [Brevundimonas sp.]|uniref:Eco57I restriction-modification methylase domain-containing protein n=1 Tax=Brevundimonas sp. TaxID=1871086 RepID=UPI00289A1F8D|nr:N-6 DNA methylase [Brevundimonas sp.]